MMGPTIAKKGNFDGLHNHLTNHFETKFLFLVILMGPTITKKRKFNTLYNLLKKTFWNRISFFGNFGKLYI